MPSLDRADVELELWRRNCTTIFSDLCAILRQTVDVYPNIHKIINILGQLMMPILTALVERSLSCLRDIPEEQYERDTIDWIGTNEYSSKL